MKVICISLQNVRQHAAQVEFCKYIIEIMCLNDFLQEKLVDFDGDSIHKVRRNVRELLLPAYRRSSGNRYFAAVRGLDGRCDILLGSAAAAMMTVHLQYQEANETYR